MNVATFNKVWIVADKADVFERAHTAYIVGAHLKVMLEEDYTALSRHSKNSPQRAAEGSFPGKDPSSSRLSETNVGTPQNDDGGIKFNIDPAMLQQSFGHTQDELQNAPGFVPIIINIQPLNNLPEFLEATN